MIIQNAKEESRDWFNRIDHMVKEDPNIKLLTKVILTGVSIYGEIIQYAEKENIDLTVIGTRRKSGIKKIY